MAHSTPTVDNALLTYQAADGATHTVAVDSPAWQAWLAEPAQRSFAIVHPTGRFTARKERKQRGEEYWILYRQVQGKLHKAYLGRSADVTLARLQAVTADLADRPTPKPAAPAGSLPSPLLMTKLFAPSAPAGLVARPRLTAHLANGLAGQLTLVSAPPGFGKTTLLAEWLPSCGRAVAWLSLETADSEPVRLLRYLIAALQTLAPAVGTTTLGLLQAPQPPANEDLLAILINDLVAQLPPSLLVLDDYHELRGSPVHGLINFFLDHLPAQLHLVIATREDPPLPLARLRTRRLLNELRVTDLRFTGDEAAAFLRQAMGLQISSADIAALEERTEGWIAGLQLAALSLREQTNASAFVAAFTGSHRYVFDYLVEEVLKRQPDTVHRFLLATSILDRLCGPLCDAVLGQSSLVLGRPPSPAWPATTDQGLRTAEPAQTILERLEHQNLFLIPLDHERRWYRYHHLFADLLRVRLRQTWPALLADLHRRASGWLAEAGLTGEAVGHALAIPDAELAARLIEQSAEPMVMRGDFATLHGWLAALPSSVVGAHPRLLLMQAWTQFLIEPYDAPAVETRLAAAEASMAAPSLTEEERAELHGIVAAIRSAVAGNQEQRELATRLAQEALALLPVANHFWRLIPTVNLGLAYDAGGAVAAASTQFAEALAMAQQAGNPYVILITTIHLGRVRAEQGQLHAAARLYGDALSLAEHHGWGRLPMVGLPHVWLAKVLYEWNQLAEATQHVTQGMRLVQRNEHRRILLEGYATLARIQEAQGDHVAAQASMRKAVELALAPAMHWAAPRAAAYQARVWLAQGDVGRAAQWLQTAQLGLDDELTMQREYEHCTLARVLIAQRQPDAALPFLARLAATAAGAGRLRSLIEIWLLSARAHALHGDERAALAVLHKALALAEPEGYRRSFVDEGASMAQLLDKLQLPDARLRPYRSALLADLAHAEPVTHRQGAASNPDMVTQSPPHSGAPSLVEPLSARELEVLGLMAAGLSNAEIAQTLVIALSTVKRHVHNICGKLDAHSRTAALARARAFGLL